MIVPDYIVDAAAEATAALANGKKTTHTLFPTSTASATPTALPTVVPDLPVVHYQASGHVGHQTLWVVCVIMGISSLAFYAMAWRVPVQKRLFHVITALVTTFAFLSYFAMATGDGVGWHTTVLKAVKHNLPTELVKRQVFWARYIDWALTTPLLLLDLSILAGLSGANILVAIIADVIMVLTGLFAAFGTHDGQKWGWYAWACLAFLTVVYQVGYNGRFAVSNRDRKTKAFFAAISLFTLVLWAVYPIIWAIGEGSRIINVDSEIIAYAVLDILAKPVFGFWLLLTHDAISRTTPSIDGFWSQGLQPEGTIRVGEGRIRDDE